MRILYLDCAMGAAGDMLTAALLELLDERESFLQEFNSLGIPGVNLGAERVQKHSLTGTQVSVLIHGEEEGEEDRNPHRHLRDVEQLIQSLPLEDAVREDVLAVYREIARAESRVHGRTAEEVHFHEVGALDAIADVTAVCMLLHRLKPDKICASPIHVGSGTVRCAHGILPVPAPATAFLLEGLPIYGGEIKAELCTPTGAALLRHFVRDFGPMPLLRLKKVGCGMGKKDFERPNCLRAFWGVSEEEMRDRVIQWQCNVDDMTGEEIAFACERLMEAGARDVWTVPIQMKKGRPGTMICVLGDESRRTALLTEIFRHTSSIGIREQIMDRQLLERREEVRESPLGPVRVKRSSGWGTEKEKLEYEDLRRLALERKLSLAEVRALLDKA